MDPKTSSLEFLQSVVVELTDIAPERVVPEAALADLGIDSLMLAETWFELEGRLELELGDPIEPPTHVAGILELVESSRALARSAGA